MVVEPEQRVPDFIKAGADIVSVHCEQTATIHLHRTINQVRFMQTHDKVHVNIHINLAVHIRVDFLQELMYYYSIGVDEDAVM